LKRTKEKKKVEDEMATIVKVKEMLTAGEHVKDGTWDAK